MTLVKTLKGSTLESDLQLAYEALAKAFLIHRGKGCTNLEQCDVTNLDASVCGTETPVDLRATRAACNLIETDQERPGEIFNNLGHMFVLLQAIAVLRDQLSLVPSLCAPTQQSGHNGQRIADLEGDGWILEAFGGFDVTNNGKLAKDLRSLSTRPTVRTFVALREAAWPTLRTALNGSFVDIRARCSRSHGGPFTAIARACPHGRQNGVTVVEVQGVSIDPSQ